MSDVLHEEIVKNSTMQLSRLEQAARQEGIDIRAIRSTLDEIFILVHDTSDISPAALGAHFSSMRDLAHLSALFRPFGHDMRTALGLITPLAEYATDGNLLPIFYKERTRIAAQIRHIRHIIDFHLAEDVLQDTMTTLSPADIANYLSDISIMTHPLTVGHLGDILPCTAHAADIYDLLFNAAVNARDAGAHTFLVAMAHDMYGTTLTLYDDGTGFTDPETTLTLFQEGVTKKPKGTGQGLSGFDYRSMQPIAADNAGLPNASGAKGARIVFRLAQPAPVNTNAMQVDNYHLTASHIR